MNQSFTLIKRLLKHIPCRQYCQVSWMDENKSATWKIIWNQKNIPVYFICFTFMCDWIKFVEWFSAIQLTGKSTARRLIWDYSQNLSGNKLPNRLVTVFQSTYNAFHRFDFAVENIHNNSSGWAATENCWANENSVCWTDKSTQCVRSLL